MNFSIYIFSILSALLVVFIPLYIIISIKTFKMLKQQEDIKTGLKTILIKMAILIVLVVVSVPVFSRTLKYYTFDKYLIENQNNNIRYTLAYVDKVWETYKGKYYTIREYTAEFIFSIDGIRYYQMHKVPDDFTNYNYFVKINIERTNYSEIIATPLKIPSNFEVPVGGWTTNPLTILSNHIIKE